MGTIREIKIDHLIVDPEVNIRARDPDGATVAAYADNAENLPPIDTFTVIDDEAKTLGEFIIDGIHRTCGRKEAGFDTVFCKNIGQGSLDQAKDLADKANLRNPLQLTLEQRIEIAVRMRARHKDLSQEELAQELGVSQPTFSQWLSRAKGDYRRSIKRRNARLPGGLLGKMVRDTTRWWNQETSKVPIEEWPIERLQACERELSKIVELHSAVVRVIEAKAKEVVSVGAAAEEV